MASLLFEFAQLDPNVIIGATVPQWSSNYRIGDSDIFIIEADEFYEKFLDYSPSTIIINNIEFDHPDYFKNENEIIKSFEKFCRLLKNDRNLIVNLDSQGVIRLLEKLKNIRGLTTYGYSLNPNPGFKTKYLITGNIVEKNPNGTRFRVYSDELGIDTEIKLTIPGDYNVSNALGVIALAKIFKIPDEVTPLVSARAIESETFFVYVNASGTFNHNGAKNLLLGKTQIALPFYGTTDILNHNKESVLMKEVDLGMIKDAKRVYRIENDLKDYYRN